ncbi:hypothetical protein J4209_05135 [Candidatus Woesearchaeota archaeon]|nr:hypothetical protein [Candidatus Woesearchaeota archaeon]
MVREKIQPKVYWKSNEGKTELFERMLNVLKVGGYKEQLSRPDPELFHNRMNQIAELGQEAGYDVVMGFGDHADSQLVRHVVGGYKTLFAGVTFALGTKVDQQNPRRSRAVLADLELGKPARFHCEKSGLNMEVYQITGVGLTGETYRNVIKKELHEVFQMLAGKNQDVHIGILTSSAINTMAFYQLVQDAAAKIPNSRVTLDEKIVPHVAFHQDEEQALSLKRMFIVASAALDVSLACASPNVLETYIAGYANLSMNLLGSIANEWDPLVGAGKHNDATIARALNLYLPKKGGLNLGMCPYNFVPAPACPTSRRFTWIGADYMEDVPKHVVQAYNGMLDAYFAVKAKLGWACQQEEPVGVGVIDQAAIDALAKHTIKYPDGSKKNLSEMQTYSSVHGSWAGECGLQQTDKSLAEEGGDMAFDSKKLIPTGICTWGHDLGVGGQGYKTPYLVCEDMGITRKPGKYELLVIVPVALERILQFTGTGVRTPDMYRNPLQR